MKKFFIFISFIFLFLSCCFTSLGTAVTIHPKIQAVVRSECSSSFENKDLNTDYFIVSSSQINILQYLSSLFGDFSASGENSIYRKFNLYQICKSEKYIQAGSVKLSYALNPRAP